MLNWIYNTSPWLVILVLSAIGMAIGIAGVMLTSAATHSEMRASHNELTSFTVTNIALLYAVLLAFIVVATWETFEKASVMAETEATFANQLYGDAIGMPEPQGEALHQAVRGYLDAVINQEWPAQEEGRTSNAGAVFLDRIEEVMAHYEPATPGKVVLMQYAVRDLDHVEEARMSRFHEVDGHLPALVWFVILAVGALTIGYSCFLKAEGLIIHAIMVGGLTLALTLVVTLIVELDYPFRGALGVSSEPFQQVLHVIKAGQLSAAR